MLKAKAKGDLIKWKMEYEARQGGGVARSSIGINPLTVVRRSQAAGQMVSAGGEARAGPG